MRQAIRDLVASVDPYVRVDAEAEDVSTSGSRLNDTFILYWFDCSILPGRRCFAFPRVHYFRCYSQWHQNSWKAQQISPLASHDIEVQTPLMSRTFSCTSVSSSFIRSLSTHADAHCWIQEPDPVSATHGCYSASILISEHFFVFCFHICAERHHHIRVPGFVSTDDMGKVPAFPGQQAPTSSQQLAGSAASGQPGAALASTTTTAATGASSGKGKEKSSTVAPTLRSKRLAAVKQATK